MASCHLLATVRCNHYKCQGGTSCYVSLAISIFYRMLSMCKCCDFFFFQAEDGIRDIGVTGVQTCALPIFEELLDELLLERIAKDDWVLVHDAARPCIEKELVEQFLDELEGDAVGGLLGIPLGDTLKSADENLRVAATIPRLKLWRAQTPQMFHYDMLRRGLEKRPLATDEAEAIESLGYYAPRLVQGEDTNIKVTFAEDLQIAQMILQLHGRLEM